MLRQINLFIPCSVTSYKLTTSNTANHYYIDKLRLGFNQQERNTSNNNRKCLYLMKLLKINVYILKIYGEKTLQIKLSISTNAQN